MCFENPFDKVATNLHVGLMMMFEGGGFQGNDYDGEENFISLHLLWQQIGHVFFCISIFHFLFLILKTLCAGVLCDGGGSDTVCLVSRNKQRDKQVSNLAHHEQDDNDDKDKEVFNLAHHDQDENDDSDDDDYCIEDEEDDFR